MVAVTGCAFIRSVWAWIVLMLLAAGACAVSMSLFAPGHSLLSTKPIYTNDFSLLLFFIHAGRSFFSHSGRLWGFDPYFMAGYPLDFIWNSNVCLQVVSVLVPWLPAALIIKGVYAACFIAPVGTLYAGLRLLGCTKGVTILGTMLGVSYCMKGLPMVHAAVGMITGCLVIHLAFLTTCLAVRFVFKGGVRTGLALAISVPLTLLVHKTSVVILLIPLVTLFILGLGTGVAPLHERGRRLLVLIGICLLAVLFNSFWIVPMLHLLPHKTFLKGTLFWQSHYLLRPIKDYLWVHQSLGIVTSSHKPGLMLLRQCIMVLALLGTISSLRSGERKCTLMFLVSSVYLFFLTYFGSFFSLTEQLDPARYDGGLNMFLIPLVCKGLEVIVGWFRSRGWAYAPGLAVIGFCVFLLGAHLLPSFYTDVRACCRLTTELPQPLHDLEDWIRYHTSQEARILIEDSGYFDRHGPGYAYYHTYFPSLLPERTARSFVGGPYPYVFLDYHYTHFQDGRLLGRDLAAYSREELDGIFERYNIGWIIVWSDEAKRCLEQFSDWIHKDRDIDKFSVYTVDRTHSYILKGSGRARATYNEIILEQLEPDDGEIVLSFHYVETLTTDPLIPLASKNLGEDPIGFIVLKSPPERVRIYLSYSF